MHIEQFAAEPPETWSDLLVPPNNLPEKLIRQYLLHASAMLPSVSPWWKIMLSPHIDALHTDDSGQVLGVNTCHDCHIDLQNNKMPKFAIAHGLYMGRADDPALGFPASITAQEWRIMSLVVGRMYIARVYGIVNGTSARNGIRGHSISCEATPTGVDDYVKKLPCLEFATMHVHITGSTTKEQTFQAKNAISVRREVVRCTFLPLVISNQLSMLSCCKRMNNTD